MCSQIYSKFRDYNSSTAEFNLSLIKGLSHIFFLDGEIFPQVSYTFKEVTRKHYVQSPLMRSDKYSTHYLPSLVFKQHQEINFGFLAQWLRTCLPKQETQKTRVQSLCQEDTWRRKWQLTPVFSPEKSQRQRSLAGYSTWGPKE